MNSIATSLQEWFRSDIIAERYTTETCDNSRSTKNQTDGLQCHQLDNFSAPFAGS